MADWYVSSTAWAALPQWAASTAYTVGNLIRPVTPTNSGDALYVFRCTTTGASATTEPSWPASNNSTIGSGGAVFTNVSGQSAYGWSAAAGNLFCMGTQVSNRPVAGDRIFISSDHSESLTSGNNTWGLGANAYGLIQIISVNRTGSVPPVATDILSGAVVGGNGGLNINPYTSLYFQGITFNNSSGVNNTRFSSDTNAVKNIYFKNCMLRLTAAGSGTVIQSLNQVKVIFDNTPVSFAYSGSSIVSGGGPILDLLWINTLSAVQGTAPTTLFTGGGSSGSGPLIICRGVDLSAVTGNLVNNATNWTCKLLLDSCRILSTVTRLAMTGSPIQEVELVNCFDGTNALNERYTVAGNVTTDRSTYLTGGALDDNGNYALKLVSNVNSDKFSMPLDSFWLDVENTAIGAAKTATVEIISSASLNTDDISLLLEYMGTSGSSVASFVSSLPATVLTAGTALTSSSNSWTVIAVASTWNTATTGFTYSNGNLTATSTTTATVQTPNSQSSGKYYFEIIPITMSNTFTQFGLGPIGSGTNQFAVLHNGNVYFNSSLLGYAIGTLTSAAVGIAVDLTAGLAWIRNGPTGNWNNSGTANPVTGAGGTNVSGLASSGVAAPFLNAQASGEAVTANFGATSFSGTVPSGFTSGWPAVPPATKQLLQVSFTPQVAGRVRGLIRLGKPSTTCWVNPQIAIT